MNLNNIVGAVIPAINSQTLVTVSASSGYTTGPDGTQTESYAAPVAISAQVQELSTSELRHLDRLNIQGNLKKLWINGQWNGAQRVNGKGGDIFNFGNNTWFAVNILEQWPDWTSIAVQLQNGS